MAIKYFEQRIKSCVSAIIKVPYHLRSFTNDYKSIYLEFNDTTPTVALVIERLIKLYPALKSNLLDESGNIPKVLSVYLNDKNIKFLNQLDTPLEAETNELSFRSILAGG